MAVEEEEDRIFLLNSQSSGEEEEEVYSKPKDKPDITNRFKKPSVIPSSPTRRKASDFPFSTQIYEEGGESTSGIRINYSRGSPKHHVTRPAVSKFHNRIRLVAGIATTIFLCGMIATAIALVVTATSRPEPWYYKTVIYQCYPQSFQDSDGDGIGDLKGIQDRVDYFSDLGIKAVWLNPIFTSPQKDNGYDVSNYTSIDPRYGNIETFKSLLDEFHSHDIHLLLDFIPNHTSDEHPWFIESKSSRDNPKRNWYVWADGSDWGDPPNNWLSLFGNSSWSYDEDTDQWYLHQFSSFQPDLNYRNPEVRQAMGDVLRFWLDLGVDGFRVDAVPFLLEDPSLDNETVNLSYNMSSCPSEYLPCYYNSLNHNLTSNYPGIHNIIREWRSIINEYSTKVHPDRILIGEAYADIDTVMSYYGNANNEFTFPFNFLLLGNTNWTGASVNCLITLWLNKMPSGATPNWVLGNHDNSRIASKAGLYLARALNTLLLTLPGTPTTYYGEELLMTNVYVPPDKRQDLYANRDPERTPMQWNTSAHAGFTFPNSTPWLPLATNYTTYNVKVESDNSTSMLSLYKKLLTDLHSSQAAFYNGTYKCLNATQDLLVYARYKENQGDYKEYYIIIINFSENHLNTGISIPFTNVERVLSSYMDSPSFELSSFRLRPGEALVVRGYLSSTCNKVELTEGGQCNYC